MIHSYHDIYIHAAFHLIHAGKEKLKNLNEKHENILKYENQIDPESIIDKKKSTFLHIFFT